MEAQFIAEQRGKGAERRDDGKISCCFCRPSSLTLVTKGGLWTVLWRYIETARAAMDVTVDSFTLQMVLKSAIDVVSYKLIEVTLIGQNSPCRHTKL